MLEYLELIFQHGGPVLPYAVVALVTWQIMNRIVKPIVSPHRGRNGRYPDIKWHLIRFGYPVYPMFIGYLISLLFSSLDTLLSIGAAASAQLLYIILKWVADKQGIKLPKDDSLNPPSK